MAAIADYRRDRAFERLYARYVRDVYRYVLAVLRNPAEAEDVTQTTFLNAYRAMLAGEEPQKPQNWLIAIAHNACRSRLRFAKRRPAEVPLDAVVEHLEVPEVERPNVGELFRALGGLPENQRAAITMRELEGRSHSEIAETLGVTVPAAEALIGRARRALRAQAQAIRGLIFILVPQSQRFSRSSEAAGGAAGSAAIAKAVALLAAAGAVAGGAGLVAQGDAAAPLPQALELRAEVVAPTLHRVHARTARAALRVTAGAETGREAPRSDATGGARRPRFDTSGDSPVASAPAPATPAAAASPPEHATGTVAQATSTVSRPHVSPVRAAAPAPVVQAVATAKTAVTQAAEPVQQTVTTVVAAVTTAAPPVPAVPPAPTLPPAPAPPPIP